MLSMILNRIWRIYRLLLYGPFPLNRSFFDRDFPPANIRYYRDGDFSRCRQIFIANGQAGIPQECLSIYEDQLKRKESAIIVIESEGKLIGSGGVQINQYTDSLFAIIISFGLIDPVWQRKGFGALLLASRIAMLDPDKQMWNVFMTSAGNGTEGLYLKAGFRHIEKSVVEGFGLLDHYQVNVPSYDIKVIREILLNSNVSIDVSFDKVLPILDKKDEYQKMLDSKRRS